MSNIRLLRSAVQVQRAWLDREALRIAAGVHGASKDSVRTRVIVGHISAGLAAEAASADADAAVEYIDARLHQIAALRQSPPPPLGGERWA